VDTSSQQTLTFADTFLWQGPLPDASKGDRSYLTRLSPVPSVVDGIQVFRPVQYLGPLSVTLVDGATTEVSGAFTDVPLMESAGLNVKGSEFAALHAETNPRAALWGSIFSLDAVPYGTKVGESSSQFSLLGFGQLFEPGPVLTTNTNFGNISFGNPYPAAWHLFYAYSDYVAMHFGPSFSVVGGSGLTAAVRPVLTTPIAPTLGPPTGAKLNGTSFFLDQTSSNLTPTISWSTPSLGTPTFYSVGIFNLSPKFPASPIVLSLSTTSTSVIVPAGLLQSANSYAFEIAAEHLPGLDVETKPFIGGPVWTHGECISGAYTIPAVTGPATGRPATEDAGQGDASRGMRYIVHDRPGDFIVVAPDHP
jgi:hypothetical protein